MDDKLLNIAIVGYKNALVGVWDPDDVNKGLPGSEEAVVYGSQELINRGYKVHVYMNPPKNSKYKNWYNVDYWNHPENKNKYDLVFMWRIYDVNMGRKRGKIVLFWPHDSPHPNFAKNGVFPKFPNFDGVCILSKHHWNQMCVFPGFDQVPYIISGNGILLEHFENPKQITNPFSIGYFSSYARGLINLILIWPSIRKEFPTATLDICYGRNTWGVLPEVHLNFIIKKIEEYKNIGVIEHGMIGHKPLADIMQRTSIWAYPCNNCGEAETFCITAVKCQASGCIPITTRIGALTETVHPNAPSMNKFTKDSDLYEYKDLLLATMKRIRDTDPEIINKERDKYITFARNYTWTACVDKWLGLYQSLIC
jgi:glycosyltransferase involved in cell wall biosynthesis